jgi:unsaturated rhamnogalacturonyl hydrolase
MNLFIIKTNVHTIIVTILVTLITSCQADNSDEEKKWSKKFFDSFISLHPDTVAYKTEGKSYKWNYEQGLILEAFYQMYKHSEDKSYFDYIKKNMDYYVEEDGNIKTYKMKDFNIDNISPGRVLLHLYNETKEEKYKKAADTLHKQLELHPRTSEGGFWHKKIYPNQMWLDGLFMAEPFHTLYAKLFDKPEIFDDVAKQFLLVEEHLKDDNTGLYYHGWDESKEQKWADPITGKSPNFWGRAIGWFMMASVDVLDYFPEDHPDRKDIIRILQNLSGSILKYRDEKTNLWFQIVDQGSREGNYIEASSSSMYAYAFAKGANKGYLEKRYSKIAEESFHAILKHLVTYDDEGHIYLNNSVSVGGLGGNPYRDGSFEYYISEPKRTNDFKGYGPFMLLAVELERSGISSSVSSSGTKTVALDYFFNNEVKDGKQYHYIWEDEEFSGFSELGNIISDLGANITSLKTSPAKEKLNDIDIYIIVDPDTPKETENPNYIDDNARAAIKDWVEEGGILVLMANDSANCEFTNLNLLAGQFGIHFNENSKNRVTGNNFDMGKINEFPDHPVFQGVNQIYLKEISTLKLNDGVQSILTYNNEVIIALSKFGAGYVFAVGDPWFYNEYIDNRKLPSGFENFKAAKNLFDWLLKLN